MTKEVKITFTLTDEQRGPFPVNTESLWFRVEGDTYTVKNIPFFIDNLSFADVITIKKLEDGTFSVENIVKPSKNSTIWVYLKGEYSEIVEYLKDAGCGVESGVIDSYYAINVPQNVDIKIIHQYLETMKGKGYLVVDYPSIRT